MALLAKKNNIGALIVAALLCALLVFGGFAGSVHATIEECGDNGAEYDNAGATCGDNGRPECSEGYIDGKSGNDGVFRCECDPEKSICNPVQSEDLEEVFDSIIRYLAIIAGALIVIIIVIAGIMFITAGESPEKRTKAIDTIKYGLVGFGIVLAAGALVSIIRVIL